MSVFEISNSKSKVLEIQKRLLAQETYANLWSPIYETKTCPLVFHSDYKNSYKEIIYSNTKPILTEDYIDFDFESMWLVDHSKYWINEHTIWEPFKQFGYKSLTYTYAFGILINPFNTKLFVLDFDSTSQLIVEKIAELFLKEENVVGVDIIKSSINESNTDNFHLYIGFDDWFNVCDLYNKKFSNSCDGFLNCARKLKEIVIRVSDKKIVHENIYATRKETLPRVVVCIRKLEHTWYAFTDQNIFYKKIEPIINNTSKKYKTKIDLRSKRGSDSTKQKSKRKKTSTVSCLKDLESFSSIDRKGCEKPTNGLLW